MDSFRYDDDWLWSKLLPFQRKGVQFAIETCQGRVLLADQMGLGKTIQAIAIGARYVEEWPMVVFCPASLKHNWAEELERWLPHILNSTDVNIVRSSSDFERLDRAKVSVVSYGMVAAANSAVGKRLTEMRPQVVILDESHNIKSRKAKRTLALRPLIEGAKRAVLISGTPALSRPAELYTQVASLRPKLFKSFTNYAKRFCNARRGRFGWDYSGCSNLGRSSEP